MESRNPSGDSNIMKINGSQKYQNVKFADQVDPYLYDIDSTMDPTRRLQDSNDATLDDFFKRPVKIAVQEWATSTTLAFDIDPWALYFENPRVANRICNYNLLRCNLHIKVIINGNGFQYGRALVSYWPFETYDSLTQNAGLVRQDLVQASQQPHIFLDPTTSQGGEMCLPFFCYTNYLHIPTSQWETMGSLYFRTLNALKHANGASDVVTISVFAWAEDVHVSVLTSEEPDTMIPQAGMETDEANAKGSISGPATTVAKVAAAMAGVPYIGPFAQATSMAATTTAAIAKMFGYSRPSITRNPEANRPTTISSLAIANVPDHAQKLTVDHKQELTIDPRVSGLGGLDALNIREIAKRESYLTTFSWPISTAPETLLWNMRLDPTIWASSVGTATAYHFPACAMAALPFRYWTGTMRVRFQIVCSAFHKGRIKVVYDPNALNAPEYNVNYLNIVDISEQSDFTVEIANGQPTTLLTHALPGVTNVDTMYDTVELIPQTYGNGVLGVYVVNELTTPNSTVNNDIEVNVFVSMGDDFEVFVPDNHFQYFVFKPQSGFEPIVPESQNTTEPSAPLQSTTMLLGPSKSDNSDINLVYTGESIASFRTILKRYNLWNAIGPLTNLGRIIQGRFSAYPYLRGRVAGAVDVTALATPYNYCNTVMLHWVTAAFSGWRGSIRYKILPRGSLNSSNMPTFYVQRHPIGENEYEFAALATPTYNTAKQVSVSTVIVNDVSPAATKPFSGTLGMAYTHGWVNPCIEFEVPYYSPYRFTPGKQENHTGVNTWNEGWDYYLSMTGLAATAFDIHVAAGEDFQVYFFTGLPRCYYEASPPE